MRAWTTLGLSTIGLLVAHGDAHGDPAATASHPDAAAYFHQFPTAKAASDFPVGLWHLDDVAYATSASHLGAALKPGGAATPAALTQVPGATRVPANGYLSSITALSPTRRAPSTATRWSSTSACRGSASGSASITPTPGSRTLYGYTLRAEQVKALGAAGGEIAAP